jgi:hypothetical protein
VEKVFRVSLSLKPTLVSCTHLESLEYQHHVIKPSDCASMLALLLLIVFEDVFNQEIYAVARNKTNRHPIKAIYTCHLKGMAWDLVDFLDKHYTWVLDGDNASFSDLFCELVGVQAAYLAILRELYKARRLGRTDDDANRKDLTLTNTETLRTELGYIVKRDERIKVGYDSVKCNPKVLSPLFDKDWDRYRVEEVGRPQRHKVRGDQYLIKLGACSRDRIELGRMKDEDPPKDIQIPYYNLS